ncbi:hypothetical protein [Absicoccus intestinalis]|uniref:Uncharacterized protein n=1 Tax=Absicoccus intestinalis TaxID=2926319 RepID=A0ABU4WLG1_9FIRM|nr:hypothetical protein [Absicoccus sp. CLA-KB-P134]MDX8417377.1 hypothetical protein [Absicoccus sp. CLA-KB-P134]
MVHKINALKVVELLKKFRRAKKYALLNEKEKEKKIMSCYVLGNESLSVIVKAFEIYQVEFRAECFKKTLGAIRDVNKMRCAMGQALLDINCASYNYRYNESGKYKFQYIDPVIVKNGKIDTGLILGCIESFEYQSCEIPNYYSSIIHMTLCNLKDAMLQRYIEKDGFEVGWA